ncbi:MAG: hypothetical protein ACKV2V_02110 [Blastocatellia bacterium]
MHTNQGHTKQGITQRAKSFRLIFVIALLSLAAMPAWAQTFSSGSTGADGALSDTALPAACARNQATITCALPASGVFNFTTVNIPAGITLQFTKNARNTPVTMLATGDVTINGVINIRGGRALGITGAEGGPGGFRGGDGGLGVEADIIAGKPGDGPGGGAGSKVSNIFGGGAGFAIAGVGGNSPTAQNGGFGGPRYGSRTLLPLIGGSGGGGTAAFQSRPGDGGGGGGGAILIASSGRILFGNTNSGIDATGGSSAISGGGGSGGGIRLVANVINGSPSLSIAGGRSENQGTGQASYGYVRVEAADYNTFSPSTSNPNYSFSKTFNPVTVPNAPQLRIASVGGVNAPAAPVGSFAAAPDITVPTSTANPVTVALQASNIPVGTVVSVTLTQENGDRSNTSSTALTGTAQSSTATASVTLPSTGISVITATATIDGLLAFGGAPQFINGERIARVEIGASFGGESRLTFITTSGKRVPMGE